MPQIVWLPEALDDLNRVYEFLAFQNPEAAVSAVQTIFAAADSYQTIPIVVLLSKLIQTVES